MIIDTEKRGCFWGMSNDLNWWCHDVAGTDGHWWRQHPIPTVNDSQKHGSRAGEASKTTGSGYRCLGGWLLTVDCIVYSDIFNTFNSLYLHRFLSIVIIETPECQHCTVWQWDAFWARENGKFLTNIIRRCPATKPHHCIWILYIYYIMQPMRWLYIFYTYIYIYIYGASVMEPLFK